MSNFATSYSPGYRAMFHGWGGESHPAFNLHTFNPTIFHGFQRNRTILHRTNEPI